MPRRALAREFVDRYNALSAEYAALVNQVIDQTIDDEHPLDDEVMKSWEARLADLTARFEQLDRDLDAAIGSNGAGLEPALA